MHIIQQPTYTAKYPPGQGLALALGQMLTGYPIVGVWISIAAACAAACWLLQGWLHPRWALLGGLLAVLWLAPSYWAQVIWGGAVAACGGALVYGALPRIVRQRQWWAGFHLGLGLAMLMCSRPYEGLVASLPAAVVLLAWSARSAVRGPTRGLPAMAAAWRCWRRLSPGWHPITPPSPAIRWSCPSTSTTWPTAPVRLSSGRTVRRRAFSTATRKWPITMSVGNGRGSSAGRRFSGLNSSRGDRSCGCSSSSSSAHPSRCPCWPYGETAAIAGFGWPRPPASWRSWR